MVESVGGQVAASGSTDTSGKVPVVSILDGRTMHPMGKETDDQPMRLTEAAAYIHIDGHELIRAVINGKLKIVTIAGIPHYTREELRAYRDSRA